MRGVSFERTSLATWEASREERRATLTRIAEVARRLPEVRLVYVFGSFIDGGPFRDLDLAVVFERTPGWQAPALVAREVGLAIGAGPEIDVVVLNDAETMFKEHIAERGRLIFERHPGDASEFVAMARSEAIDLREWRRTRALEGRLGS